MNKFTVLIPNRFEDVIQPLLSSLKVYEPEIKKVVIIADGHERSYGYETVTVGGPFIFSHSVNVGIKYTEPDDIILLNDDVRLLHPNTFEDLAAIATNDKRIGILTPLVDGGCGNIYMRASRTDLWTNIPSGVHFTSGLGGGNRITFACVYIKRELINQIGLMDEKFSGYGYDDADYCIRTVKAGWRLAITNRVKVQHGDGGEKFVRGENWNSSYMRNRIGGSKRNLDYLMTKHKPSLELR